MNYAVKFPNKRLEKQFEKTLNSISKKNLKKHIIEALEGLASNPRPEGKIFKTLRPPIELYHFTAQYRLRIGDYRILYDVNETTQSVWIFALRKRDESTYR